MYILEVIPIAKGLPFDTMTYLHNGYVEPGAVANIDIGGRKAKAIVINCRTAEESKASIRSVNFKLKKVDSIASGNHDYKFTTDFISSIIKCAHYHMMEASKLLSYLTPSDFIDYLLSGQSNAIYNPKNHTNEFEFIYYPTIEEVNSEYEKLKNNHVHLFKMHSEVTALQKQKLFSVLIGNITNNKKRSDIKDDESKSSPANNHKTVVNKITIISTPNIIPSFLIKNGDTNNVKVKIMNAKSNYYYHPFFDFNLLDIMALNFKLCGVSYNTEDAKYNLDKINIIDMEEDSNLHNRNYLFSKAALTAIAKLQNKNDLDASPNKIIFYTPRRGLAPTSVCDDCGTMVKCDICSSPMVLHNKSGARIYECHKCEKRGIVSQIIVNSEKELLCKSCGGWRIHLRGISTHMLTDELQKYGIPTFITDGDTTPNKSKISKTIKSWLESPSAILITNDISLPYLESKMLDILNSQTVAAIIPSIDGLLSMPEYTVNYKILDVLNTLNKISNHNVILQSRNIKNTILDFISKNKIAEFLELESLSRKMAELPPDYVIIKFYYNQVYNRSSKAYDDYMSDALRKRLEDFLSPLHIYWYSSYAHIFIKSEDYMPELQDKLYIALSGFSPVVNPRLLHG